MVVIVAAAITARQEEKLRHRFFLPGWTDQPITSAGPRCLRCRPTQRIRDVHPKSNNDTACGDTPYVSGDDRVRDHLCAARQILGCTATAVVVLAAGFFPFRFFLHCLSLWDGVKSTIVSVSAVFFVLYTAPLYVLHTPKPHQDWFLFLHTVGVCTHHPFI